MASLNINITRVSYNKVVDSNTLFIDAEGSPESLKSADKKLAEIGYLQDTKNSNIILIEFTLTDKPGSVTEILKIINRFNFNISYISSQENGTDVQYFKMGLFVDNEFKLAEFLKEAEKICKVRVIDYNHSEKVYDNSIFYNTFVNGLVKTLNISDNNKNELLVNANLAMQILDEHGLSPHKTFDSINRFAELLAKYRYDKFAPRITIEYISDNSEIITIEPPCGSNTIILKSNNDVLFIDSGYALYKNEMFKIFKKLLPEFDRIKKRIFVTHADVDHCGLLPHFDEIITSKNTADCLKAEYNNIDGFREKNHLHKPYIKMCKILTSYMPPAPEKITTPWTNTHDDISALCLIGNYNFGELNFEVYEGKGGHLKGETIFVERKFNIAFTGDVFINTHGLTQQQAEYNKYAPILMTSVDTDSKLCAEERKALKGILKNGEWQIYGAHGSKISLKI